MLFFSVGEAIRRPGNAPIKEEHCWPGLFCPKPAQTIHFHSRLALSRRGAYGGCGVKQPFVNPEEKIDRFVGRRTKTADRLEAAMQSQAAAVEFHRAFRHRWAPKGVYCFKTHKEADQWMMKMLARADQSKT